MNNLTIKSLAYLSSTARDVYEKHIENKQIRNDVKLETRDIDMFTLDDVSDIVCLYIYGAKHKDIIKLYNVKNVSGIYLRNSYRKVAIPFQISKKKKLGMMVFTYDKTLVEDYFSKMSKEKQDLTTGILDESKLETKTKIHHSEIIL